MTPRYAAAAVVSAVVLRRPTKEYTRRYSVMHRRLTTASIEVAPHYHQLLAICTTPRSFFAVSRFLPAVAHENSSSCLTLDILTAKKRCSRGGEKPTMSGTATWCPSRGIPGGAHACVRASRRVVATRRSVAHPFFVAANSLDLDIALQTITIIDRVSVYRSCSVSYK